jgi:hypothetical protein
VTGQNVVVRNFTTHHQWHRAAPSQPARAHCVRRRTSARARNSASLTDDFCRRLRSIKSSAMAPVSCGSVWSRPRARTEHYRDIGGAVALFSRKPRVAVPVRTQPGWLSRIAVVEISRAGNSTPVADQYVHRTQRASNDVVAPAPSRP